MAFLFLTFIDFIWKHYIRVGVVVVEALERCEVSVTVSTYPPCIGSGLSLYLPVEEKMILVTELRAGVIFEHAGDPLQVTKYLHKQLGRGKANIRIKAKNLRTGATLDKVFNSGAKVEEAAVVKKSVQFLYQDGKQLHFTDLETGDKVSLPMDGRGKFLAKNTEIKLLSFEDEPLGIELPPTVELKVKKTEPGIKGNSATNIYKPATLESGHTLQVPLFINEGDTIKVNTETGKYVSRM